MNICPSFVPVDEATVIVTAMKQFLFSRRRARRSAMKYVYSVTVSV
jgi:hypothetical protein